MTQNNRTFSIENNLIKSQIGKPISYSAFYTPKNQSNEMKSHRRFPNDLAIQLIRIENDNRELKIKIMQKNDKIHMLKQEIKDLKETKSKQEEYFKAEINYLKRKQPKELL